MERLVIPILYKEERIMKSVTEVKGDKVDKICTGKGAFSAAGFSDLVGALANDSKFSVTTYGKDGQPNGSVNISELIRGDIKKSVANAKYPQKSEEGVLDSSEICTKGLAKAIPYMVEEYLKTGKKFDLPQQPTFQGSIYLADQPGRTKVSKVRDIQTKKELGTSTTVTKDSVQVRVKSPVPASCVVSKTRRDLNGNVMK